MSDPKDDHQAHYTSTPPDDRVGSLDRTDIPNVLPPDDQDQPGHTDKGADHPAVTRDPAMMEHALQGADYAGSDEPDPADPGIPTELTTLGPGNIGINALPVRDPIADADQNPHYTPPSNQGPREVADRPAEMPEGAPGEAATERALGTPEGADGEGRP